MTNRPTHKEETQSDGGVETIAIEYAVVRNDKLNELLWKIQDQWHKNGRKFGPKWATLGQPALEELGDTIDDLCMFINELSDDVHNLCNRHTYEVAESDAIKVNESREMGVRRWRA